MSGKFTLLLAEVQPFEQHYARCDEERERDHDGPDSFLFRCERDAWWHGCDCPDIESRVFLIEHAHTAQLVRRPSMRIVNVALTGKDQLLHAR